MGQPNKGKGQYSEINKKVIWGSRCHGGHECCKQCSTNDKRHKGGGLCISCYDKWRAKKPKRKEQLQNQHDKWYDKVRGTEEYNKYSRERAKIFRNKVNPESYRASYYRANEKKRLVRFLNGGRIYKKYMTIICTCCGEKCVAPFTEAEAVNKQKWVFLFREMLIEKHKSEK